MALIGISGKKGSGKDTVGKIIQYLYYVDSDIHTDKISYEEFTKTDRVNNILYNGAPKIKKFASTLKDWVCDLTNCTREQLEDEDFKNQELGEEWWYYTVQKKYSTERLLVAYDINNPMNEFGEPSTLVKPTRRNLLETIGTDCGRMMVHPNIWVNELMSKYKPPVGKTVAVGDYSRYYPNWIITDVRFHNELKAIKDKGGISIRVNRRGNNEYTNYLKFIKTKEATYEDLDSNQYLMSFDLFLRQSKSFIARFVSKEHISETELDNTVFDFTIDNSGSIERLIEDVKLILQKEGIIN